MTVRQAGRAAGLAALAAALAWSPPTFALALALAVLAMAAAVSTPLGLAGAALAVPFGSLVAFPLGAGRLTPALPLLAWTACAAALGALAAGRPRLGAPPLAIPLALFAAALAAAAWRAPEPLVAVVEVARWVELALALALAAALCKRPRALRAVLAGALLAGIAAGAVGIAMAVARIGPPAFAILGGRLVRAHGTFGQPNPFGGYMNMVWPVGAALALEWLAAGRRVGATGQRAVGPGLALVGLVAAAVCGMGVVLSWSRGAWLAAAAGAALAAGVWSARALRPPWSARPVALVGAAAGAVVILLAAGTTERLPASVTARLASIGQTAVTWDVAGAEVDDANFATVERVAHWEAAGAMWAERPWLGQGPGHYELAYPRFRLPRWDAALGHAHNTYLNFLAESGLVGLAGYLVLFGAALAMALRAALFPASGLHAALGTGLLAVLGALAVHGLLDNLYVHDTTAHLGLLLGLTAAAGARG